MRSKKRFGLGALVLALCLSLGVSFSADAAKKKPKKAGKAVVTNATPRPIPDRIPGTPTTPSTFGKLATPLAVPKKFKGLNVADVKVTAQTTGLTAAAAADLQFRITAPNGRTIGLNSPFTGQSIGPHTWTANSPVQICSGSAAPPPPPCDDPDDTLGPPYFGTSGDVNLSFFEGIKMAGTWTVSVLDTGVADTSTLNSVKLEVTPAPAATTGGSSKKK